MYIVNQYTSEQQKTIAVHEMGHNLGFDHWTSPCDSIMGEPPCDPYVFTSPQTRDVNNYATAYFVDPPSGLSGNSTSPGVVSLSWDPSQIHNEGSFAIWSAPQGTSNWSVASTAGQDASGKTFGHPSGSYQFAVGGWTGAACIPSGGYCGTGPSVPITVMGPPAAPSSISSEFEWLSGYGVWANKLSWPSVSGADHYHICTDENRTGSYSTCYDASGTYYYWAIPTDDDHDHYYKVKACTSSNECSGLTTDWAQTQRSNVDGWNYVFTFYKSGSNIRFQYVNLMVYGLGLNLHIRNGSSGTSPIVSDTSGRTVTVCVANNAKSSLLTYARSKFTGTYPKVGTNGHSALAGGTCRSNSDHSQDYTLDSRWGYRP